MNIEEQSYLISKSHYKTKINEIMTIYDIQEVKDLTLKIRNTAKDALSELICPRIAKDEISNLEDLIKKIKEGLMKE